MSMPAYPWYRLRKEQPQLYENAIIPAPEPNGWFHAMVIIDKKKISVFVDHTNKASLVIIRPLNQAGTVIGLFDEGLPGDFANLIVKSLKSE